MSKTWLRGGGVLLVLLTLVSVSRSRPDPSPQPMAQPTRVAVVNLPFVIKHLKVTPRFQAEIKGKYKQYEERVTELGQQGEALSKRLKDLDTPAEKRQEIEKEIAKIKGQIEECNAEAKKVLGKRGDEQIVTLYTTIRKAAEVYAKAHGIDLVLHYMDGTGPEDRDSAKNLAKILESPACFPLYAAPELDISKELIAELNAKDNDDNP
jgi:Skp family chaperone for outer membrane proteins